MGKYVYQVVLDNKQGIFYPGQIITGRVELELVKETKSRAIYLNFHGYAGVHWREQNGDTTVLYSSDETYCHNELVLYGKEQTGQDETKIQPGKYTYPFSIQLPKSIPSSYESYIGQVRYEFISHIDVPWGFNKETERKIITVVNLLDLNTIPEMINGATATDQKNLCCLCCESDPISATVTIDRTGYVPGESIPFRAEINNQSNREMTCSKAMLIMAVSYHAVSKTNVVHNVLHELRHGAIEAGGTDMWLNEKLHIPPVPPSYLQGCSIIDVQYYLAIKVEPFIGFSLNVLVDVVIGSIPLKTVAQQHGLTIPTDESAVSAGSSTGIYSDTFIPANMPNVTLAESVMGRMSTHEEGASHGNSGVTDFAPVYTYYNWDKPDHKQTFSVQMKEL